MKKTAVDKKREKNQSLKKYKKISSCVKKVEKTTFRHIDLSNANMRFFELSLQTTCFELSLQTTC
jgi:hypothetical protein